MAQRRGHGRGAGQPRIEVLPPDELPSGVSGPALVESTTDRDARGRFQRGSRSCQSAGGQSLRGTTKLSRQLALGETFKDARFAPYAAAAQAFRSQHVTSLARDVGGGVCGTAPSSIIASAALQLAASRFAFEVLGDMVLGSRLANDSRQNLLAAHELVAREAQARAHHQGDELARAQQQFQRQLAAAHAEHSEPANEPSSTEAEGAAE